MPIYAMRCRACGSEQDIFRKIAEMDRDLPMCCEQPMQRRVCAPVVFGDVPGYESPVTGQWIEGRAARRDDLARHGCRPWEGMDQERKYAAEAKRQIEAKDEKELDDAARTAWNTLKPAERRALESA